MPDLSARLSIGFSWAGHTTMHILSALFLTVVLALEPAWSMTYDDLIRLWTVGSLMIGLGAPLAGWLGDRWSDARMMVLFFLLTGIFSQPLLHESGECSKRTSAISTERLTMSYPRNSKLFSSPRAVETISSGCNAPPSNWTGNSL